MRRAQYGEIVMSDGFEFEKEISIEVEFELESEVKIEVEKDVDIDVKIESYVDLEGNYADVTFSAEAIGCETFAEADVHVLVIEGELSSVDGYMVAAAG
jgi:hypothetical protein